MAKRNLRGLVLSFEERKRLADYFVVLITVHKKVKVHEKESKKAKKAKGKLTDIGPRIRGPCFIIPFCIFIDNVVYS